MPKCCNEPFAPSRAEGVTAPLGATWQQHDAPRSASGVVSRPVRVCSRFVGCRRGLVGFDLQAGQPATGSKVFWVKRVLGLRFAGWTVCLISSCKRVGGSGFIVGAGRGFSDFGPMGIGQL